MGTVSAVPQPSQLQQELAAVEEIGVAAASPFIHSVAGQAKVQAITGEINLGIAALPLLVDLLKAFGNMITHLHQTAVAQPAAPAATKVSA